MEPSAHDAARDAGPMRAFDVLGKRWNGLILSVPNDRRPQPILEQLGARAIGLDAPELSRAAATA